MAAVVHLEVIKGTDRGLPVTIPSDGARLGRSSKNDVVLRDALLSRHHCRLFFKDDRLWVADLGSSNETLVNEKPVRECQLEVGDRVTVGDTVLEVKANTLGAGAEDSAPLTPPAPERAPDLGLQRVERSGRKPLGAMKLVILGVVLLVLILVAWIVVIAVGPWLSQSEETVKTPPPLVAAEPEASLEIRYEKVEATPENIFRYELTLTRDGVVAVQIDDIENDRHVRDEKAVDSEYIALLADSIRESGFFGLQAAYEGIQPDLLAEFDLSVTMGRETHRTRVINRVEPDVFKAVREEIEEFGKNELSLWAIQFSPEKLVGMAHDSYLLGQKLYDEREIRYGNLAQAAKAFNLAEWYLQTVEPKPDFYKDIVASTSRCREALEEKYQDYKFQAERAIQLRDWETAAMQLRVLLELVPDRGDERNQEARKNLIDIERRLKTSR